MFTPPTVSNHRLDTLHRIRFQHGRFQNRRVKGNFLPLGIALVIFNPVERDYNKLGFEFGLRRLAQYQFSRPSIKYVAEKENMRKSASYVSCLIF